MFVGIAGELVARRRQIVETMGAER